LKAIAVAALGAAVTVGAPAMAQQKMKVGYIYVGPVGDFGWSYQHDAGRKAVVARYGDRVETTFVESVSEGPDAERVIEQLARSGHKLIFTTSFGFMEPTLKVAQRFPNVWFEHATGFKRAPNLATYDARFYEGRYIIGQIAGRMSKSGTVGYIASFPIPEVVAGINAFMLGAQSVRPDMKIKIVWVNSWYDPGKEADAAKALISQGADVLSQHTDSAAAMQVAQERGVFAFGQASDMIKFGPKAQLTSIIDDWAPYYVERVGLALDGKWTSGAVWDGLDKGKVQMAPYTSMAMHVFKCPMVRQDGAAVECKGNGHLSDEQIAGINFYIRGIDDKLPN
jgi:simple sugar transport system substrate-binding protein